MLVLPVQLLPHAEGLALPQYETPGAAGFDLLAAIAENSPLKMEKFGRACADGNEAANT